MIVDLIKVFLLSLIEAFTEFLPVSSTGHMIILEKFLKLSNNKVFVNSFQIIIQLGAIFAVIWIFFDKIYPFNKKEKEKEEKMILWGKIIASSIPAIIFGLLLDDIIEKYFFNEIIVIFMLIFYGFLLIVIEKRKKTEKINLISDISIKTAVLIGFFQCLAMIPGTSRSAATIIGAMILGLSRMVATEFSFFMAIPIMLGATSLKLFKNINKLSIYEFNLILIGLVITFFLSLIIIKKFLNYIKKNDFRIFGYYRIILGIFLIFLIIFKII